MPERRATAQGPCNEGPQACVGNRGSGLKAESVKGGEGTETGAILILALIYILTISLIVIALSTWATNNLNNTAHFTSARLMNYSASNATELAIQNIRYAPLVDPGQTLLAANNPTDTNPSYCWGNGAPSHLLTDAFDMAVWCSTVQYLGAAPRTRVVTFSTCLATVSNTSCALNPLLQAVVSFNDYAVGGSTSFGAGAVLEAWDWGSTVGSSSGLKANFITINSSAPSNATVGGTYTPSASATSLDPVAITSATVSVCTISGGVVHFIANGVCTLSFNDAGNSNYGAATQIQQTFSVGQTASAITINSSAPSSATVGGTYTPSASATSGDAVVITSATTSVCTVSGGVVHFIGAGTCTLNFDDPGNVNYNAAPQLHQSMTVAASSSGTYSGNTNNATISSSTALYYPINPVNAAAGSSNALQNGITPSTTTTTHLTSMTFTLDAPSPSSTYNATVGVISGGSWASTGLSCTIPLNTPSCTVAVSVNVAMNDQVNVQVHRVSGSFSHSGSWTVAYTHP